MQDSVKSSTEYVKRQYLTTLPAEDKTITFYLVLYNFKATTAWHNLNYKTYRFCRSYTMQIVVSHTKDG